MKLSKLAGVDVDKKEKNEILNFAFNNNQNIILLADSKANIFITIQGLLVTIGIAGALISDTFQKLRELVHPVYSVFYVILLIFYTIFSLIGMITAICVFSPRGPKEKKEQKREGIFYYGHINQLKNSGEYIKKVKNIDEEQLFDEFCRQIFQLAKIAYEKMEFVKKGVIFLYINISLTICLLIMTIILHLVW